MSEKTKAAVADTPLTEQVAELQRQLERAKSQLSLLRQENQSLKTSFAYQIGSLLADGLRSPKAFLLLPLRLLRLLKRRKSGKFLREDPIRVLQQRSRQRQAPYTPVPKRICYVLHNSLPYTSGGYATRAHGIAIGLQRAGYEIVCLTRPGFPADVKKELDESQVPLTDVIDGIRYVRSLRPHLGDGSYVHKSTEIMADLFREYRPEAVITATTNAAGLYALAAAKQLGIPHIYEVRGFWEITRLSREPEYEQTGGYRRQVAQGAKAATEADHVITLTGAMRDELISRGVKPANITLAPNSCDPDRFLPRPRDEALASRLGIPAGVPVIGYIGTFVIYEGLEHLAEACALLKAKGIAFRLMLVGNENTSGTDRGEITGMIYDAAEKGGFSDWLILPGRVPHHEVESYYSLVDIAPFPRKPWPVCEMVSPMKPLEAMAMEKAVLVSSVRALAEMITEGETGISYEKGNIADMAARLEQLINDPALRERLGRNGRQWVESRRTWDKTAQIIAEVVEGLLPQTQKTNR